MSIFHKYNLYTVEADSGRIFLYAPLSGIIAETSHEELCKFEKMMSHGVIPPELNEIVRGDSVTEDIMPDVTSELTILINQRCNFACKYCYSANGRSNAELPESLFEPLTNWFIDPAKRGKRLSVTFSGGGDPTLSIDKVRKLVTTMQAKASAVGVNIDFGMVCNGSRINPCDIDFIKKNFANLVISFDVIPEVHNAQRSHYSVVVDTIRKLIDAGVKFGLRSTITRLNVDRMVEMIEVLHRDLPECKSIAAEAVLSPEMWSDNTDLALFYSRFATNYFKAQQLAENYGITLGNTIEISSDGLKARACEGKVVVTPEGQLTACSRIASPGDNHFDDFVFGRVTDKGITYDAEKYQGITRMRAENFAECHGCFARYHCGGGCMLTRLAYSEEQMRLHCEFTRQILKQKLFNELDR